MNPQSFPPQKKHLTDKIRIVAKIFQKQMNTKAY